MENQQFKKLIKEALTPNFLKESVHYRLKLLQKVEDADEKISMDKRANREWLKALDDDEISFSHYSDDELEQLLYVAHQIMKDHSMSYIPESVNEGKLGDELWPEDKDEPDGKRIKELLFPYRVLLLTKYDGFDESDYDSGVSEYIMDFGDGIEGIGSIKDLVADFIDYLGAAGYIVESVNEVFDPEGDYNIQYEIDDYEIGDQVVVLPSLTYDPVDKQGEMGIVTLVDIENEIIEVTFKDREIGRYNPGNIVFPGDENYRHREDEWSVNA